MPTHLTRYILSEILKIFFVALLVLTMLILLIGVARKLLSEGLGPLAVVQLLPFLIPVSLQFSFPATSLFSVCCVYGRMSADGEIATIKASGISPLRVLQPALIFAALLSPIAVYLSDLSVSWGRTGVNRVVLLSIEDVVYRVLRAQHSYTSNHGFSIHVREVEGRTLIHPTVTVHNNGKNGPMKLSARRGRLTLDADRQELLLQVVDSQVEGGKGFQGIVPGETEFKIPLGGALRVKDVGIRSPSELPLRLIGNERIQQGVRAHAAVGEMAAHTGFAVMTSRSEDIAGATGRLAQAHVQHHNNRLVRLHAEPWRRWAEGFSCFFFVLVGAPLAIIAKTSDYWTTFGLCFLPTLVLYFPLFLLGLEQAKDGNVPPYGVWMANVVLCAIGVVLIARVRRY